MSRPLNATEWVIAALLGCAVRLGAMQCVEQYDLSGDAQGYALLGSNLLEHQTLSLSTSAPYLPTSIRPPLYPALVAVAQFLGGSALKSIWWLQALLSIGTALLLARALGRYLPEAQRALLWVLALIPFDAMYTGALWTEALSGHLMMLVFAALLWRGRRRWFWVGVCFGALCLVRDVYLVLPVGFAGLVGLHCLKGLKVKRRLPGVMAAALGILLVVGPWTVRNAIAFGQFIPVSKGLMGFNLWLGTWERNGDWLKRQANGDYSYPDYAFSNENERQAVTQLNQGASVTAAPNAEADRFFLQLAVTRLKSQPLQVLATCVRRHWQLWLGSRNEQFQLSQSFLKTGSTPWKLFKMASWGLCLVQVAAGLGGLLFANKRRRHRALAQLCLVPIVMTAAVYFPFHNTESRYSLPVVPLLEVGVVMLGVVLMHWRTARWSVAQPQAVS